MRFSCEPLQLTKEAPYRRVRCQALVRLRRWDNRFPQDLISDSLEHFGIQYLKDFAVKGFCS